MKNQHNNMKKMMFKIFFTIESSMTVLGVNKEEAKQTWLRDMKESNELFNGKIIKIEDTGTTINL